MVLAIAVQTTMQIASAVALLAVLQDTAVTLDRIKRLAQAPPEPIARQRVTATAPAEGGIVVRNVSFSYPTATIPSSPTSTWRCRPARPSPSSARTAPARAP
jgi:ABC-type bacteriocin/lantibiotic exporter with double-glycine peptidase domain